MESHKKWPFEIRFLNSVYVPENHQALACIHSSFYLFFIAFYGSSFSPVVKIYHCLFNHSLIRWKTFWLFWFLAIANKVGMNKHRWVCVDICFHLSGINLRGKIAVLYVHVSFFFKETSYFPFSIPISHVGETRFLRILASFWYCHYFLF